MPRVGWPLLAALALATAASVPPAAPDRAGQGAEGGDKACVFVGPTGPLAVDGVAVDTPAESAVAAGAPCVDARILAASGAVGPAGAPGPTGLALSLIHI